MVDVKSPLELSSLILWLWKRVCRVLNKDKVIPIPWRCIKQKRHLPCLNTPIKRDLSASLSHQSLGTSAWKGSGIHTSASLERQPFKRYLKEILVLKKNSNSKQWLWNHTLMCLLSHSKHLIVVKSIPSRWRKGHRWAALHHDQKWTLGTQFKVISEHQ